MWTSPKTNQNDRGQRQMERCPICAEEIQDEAIVCQYCTGLRDCKRRHDIAGHGTSTEDEWPGRSLSRPRDHIAVWAEKHPRAHIRLYREILNDESEGPESGRGLAIVAGIVLGWIGVGLVFLILAPVIIDSEVDPLAKLPVLR
jgi:hypothetical protein